MLYAEVYRHLLVYELHITAQTPEIVLCNLLEWQARQVDLRELRGWCDKLRLQPVGRPLLPSALV